MPNTPPITVAEASKTHNIPKRTIQAAIHRGDLKAHKLGGTTGAYLIEPHELTRWLLTRNPPNPDGETPAA
jgi:excisionase family DNA binding protein